VVGMSCETAPAAKRFKIEGRPLPKWRERTRLAGPPGAG
jgi:hypothetical protein